jgi:hypothetical protein
MTGMDKMIFDRELHEQIERYRSLLPPNTNFQPLIGNGHPFDAEIIFVGDNPTGGCCSPPCGYGGYSPVTFDTFWRLESGFDLHKYRVWRDKISPTQRRLVDFAETKYSVFLSTNTWWACSSKTSNLPANCRVDAPLEWLFCAIFSGANRHLPIVVHGGQAKKNYMRINNKMNLPDAIYCSHFSRRSLSNFERDESLAKMLDSGSTGDTQKK